MTLRVRSGVDLVHVPALAQKLARSPQLREELFSIEELAYCDGRPNSVQHLAARFAAKEALVKAFGLDALGLNLSQLSIAHDANARPLFRLDCPLFRAQATAAADGATFDVDVSLSHDGDYAIAFVVVQVHAP